MKILILGYKGMLGHDLMVVFKEYHPIGWDIRNLDITKSKQVFSKISKIKPDILINAAAYTDVDGAEKNKALVRKINSQAVGYLARACLRLNATFVHFSTDYVFSGYKKGGYYEKNRPTKPINFYGLSKLGGEKEILKLKNRGLRYYLIRTAWLFGPKARPHQHKNFVDTILRLARTEDEIKVVNDQWGCPTYSYDLAQAVKAMIEKKLSNGVYHITNSEATTWYKFAKSIIRFSKNEAPRSLLRGIKRNPPKPPALLRQGSGGFSAPSSSQRTAEHSATEDKLKISPCRTKEYLLPAKRPKYVILLNTKLPRLRSWSDALRDYLKN